MGFDTDPGSAASPTRLEIPASVAGVPQATKWLEEIWGDHNLPASVAMPARLCLEEAVTNVVMHAIDDIPVETIWVELERHPSHFVITVIDAGPKFDPRSVDSDELPEDPANAFVGGRGLTLIRDFSKEIDYEHRDGKNHFRIHFEAEEINQAV